MKWIRSELPGLLGFHYNEVYLYMCLAQFERFELGGTICGSLVYFDDYDSLYRNICEIRFSHIELCMLHNIEKTLVKPKMLAAIIIYKCESSKTPF